MGNPIYGFLILGVFFAFILLIIYILRKMDQDIQSVIKLFGDCWARTRVMKVRLITVKKKYLVKIFSESYPFLPFDIV